MNLLAMPGDFNADGIVDLADYTVWRDKLGAAETVVPAGTTTDGSGFLDAGDYATWKANFDAPAVTFPPRASHAVPEPDPGWLTLLVGPLVILARQRSSCRELTSVRPHSHSGAVVASQM